VRIGAPDPSLTGFGGLACLAELIGRLGVVETLDAHVGPVKQRNRGLSGGQLLVALAQAQMCGEDFLVGLDRRRADRVGEELSAVPTPPSTTAAALARRFDAPQWLGVEDGLAALTGRVVGLLPAARRGALLHGGATVDLDTTDIEVYGRRKRGVAYNYQGQRAGRVHLASWAEAGTPLAADLLDGRSDARSYSVDLLGRALTSLAAVGSYRPADPTAPRPRVRADAGYLAGDLARAAVEADADFAIGVRRGPAVWRALATVAADAWTPALGMPGAQVALADYAPQGWPEGTRCLVRRVRHSAAEISTDPRARRRRTIPAQQLALALDGELDEVYGYSFIATNLPLNSPAETAAVERWYRSRTDSRTGSATPNTAPRWTTCPPATPTSTPPGSGPPCSRSP
jgi:hypothetical protein